MAVTKKSKTTKRKSSKLTRILIKDSRVMDKFDPDEKKLSFVFAIADKNVKWSIKPSGKCRAITVGGETDPERAPYYIEQIVKDAVEKLFPKTDDRPEHEKIWDQLYLQLIPWRKKGYKEFALEISKKATAPGCMVIVKFSKDKKEKGMPFYFDDEGTAKNFEAYARPLIAKINSKEWNQ